MDVNQDSVTQPVSLVPGQDSKQARHQSCGAERAQFDDCFQNSRFYRIQELFDRCGPIPDWSAIELPWARSCCVGHGLFLPSCGCRKMAPPPVVAPSRRCRLPSFSVPRVPEPLNRTRLVSGRLPVCVGGGGASVHASAPGVGPLTSDLVVAIAIRPSPRTRRKRKTVRA